jgi:dipeptidyl aminopeptidase/acylaminoacyl peptidase
MNRTPRALASLLAAGFFVLPLPPSSWQKELRLEPLPVEALLSARSLGRFAVPRLSPDGQWVAYTVCDPRRVPTESDPKFKNYSRTGVWAFGTGCDVWVAKTRTGDSRNVTEEKGSNWAPTWSPDGSTLAFYSDRSGPAAVWLWERESGSKRRLSDLIVRPLGPWGPAWTPDGRRLVVRVLPAGMTVEQAAELGSSPARKGAASDSGEATVTVYRSSARKDRSDEPLAVGAWSTESDRADLAVVDVSSGASRRIVTGEKLYGSWLSPDGSRVACLVNRGFAGGSTQHSLHDLVVAPLDGAPSRIVATKVVRLIGLGVSWSPDGTTLAYVAKGGEWILVPAAGGEARKAAKQKHPAFRDDEYAAPAWDPKSEHLYFIADNGLWRVSVRDGSAAAVARIPGYTLREIVELPAAADHLLLLARQEQTFEESIHAVLFSTGIPRELWRGAKSLGDPYVRIHASKDAIVFGAQDAGSDEDLWVLPAGAPEARRVTRVNPAFDRYVMGSGRLIEWRSLEGEALKGALLLPAGYEEGRRYPLVVFVYGGGQLSSSLRTFGMRGGWGPDDNFQLLATRGYAVLLPDARSDWKDQMRDLPKTVLPGVNRVIELGIADPDRLGIMGHSNGGYSTLALISLTKRFKAAIMRAGLGNFVSFYGEFGKDGSHYGLGVAEHAFGMGTPWESRSRYIENSPVFYLDRVETPLLIVHGSLDDAVAPFLAEEVFVGLRRLGKEVVYARYEGEGHSIESYANQVDYVNRMIAWFDRHLKKDQK